MSAAALHQLGCLLHLADPNLPIGGFSHSGGLETFIQQRVITDAASLRQFIQTQLNQNWRHNDGAYMALAYDAGCAQDVATLLALDAHIASAKSPRQLREGSCKLGMRLLKIFMRQPQPVWVQTVMQAVESRQAKGFYPLVFGMLAAALGLDKAQSLYAFYYNMAVGMVTNGVKLIPLSQMIGQDMIIELQQDIIAMVEQSLTHQTSHLGAATLATDIRAMQHERLYSRLYMS